MCTLSKIPGRTFTGQTIWSKWSAGSDLYGSESPSKQFIQITVQALGENMVVVDGQLSSRVNDLFAGNAVATFSLDSGQTF